MVKTVAEDAQSNLDSRLECLHIKFRETQMPENSSHLLGSYLSYFTSQRSDLYLLGQDNQVFVYLYMADLNLMSYILIVKHCK